MNKALKEITGKVVVTTALALSTMGGTPTYGLLDDRPVHVTTKQERLFIDKQGYKNPSVHDREDQRKRRLIRKAKKKRGHKHGGGRK